MIRFDNVTKTFPTGTAALSGVSFTVDPGELVAITGPSGSGKTTILRLLLREMLPTEGSITVDDLDVVGLKTRDLPRLRRMIGAVFQDFKLLEDRTAAENVRIVLEMTKSSDGDITSRTEEVLALVDLSDRGGYFPRQLSGGELQRVAIARALALKPPIVFADEPTGNLDSATAKTVAECLKQIHESGTAVIVATHDRIVLETLKSRTLKLTHGRLVTEENP